MKNLIYLLVSLSIVAFVSCSDDDKDDSTNSNGNTQTENGNGSSNSSSQPAVIVGTENGHEWVDLGLTSGTKWATCNVGATKPQNYGNYYAWGETTTKSIYTWNNYKYGSAYNQLTKYCSKSSYGKDGFVDNKTTLDPEDDAAAANWGGKWRMPTLEQWTELRKECYWLWTESYNGSNTAGWIVYKSKTAFDKGDIVPSRETPSSLYSLSDAHIFLPVTGYRASNFTNYAGSEGYFWSSSLEETYDPSNALDFDFISDMLNYGSTTRYPRVFGMSVRAVCML